MFDKIAKPYLVYYNKFKHFQCEKKNKNKITV